MAIETSYTQARAGLARLLDRVADDREIVLIQRRRRPPVAMIAADELSSLLETAHLMRAPANARRLLTALRRALGRRGRPQRISGLRRDLGLDETR
jgi:antitoxin YefM